MTTPACEEVKEFRVASVSSNRNSFGLRGHIMVARDGEAWQMGASHHHEKKKGETLEVLCVDGIPQWQYFGFEIPERLEPDAPPGAIKEVWEDIDADKCVPGGD